MFRIASCIRGGCEVHPADKVIDEDCCLESEAFFKVPASSALILVSVVESFSVSVPDRRVRL